MSRERVEQIITQGIHRFLADGVHYRDLIDIRAAIADWSQWCAVWSRYAAAAEERGARALARSLTRTAATEFARSALYFHYAQNLYYDDPALKRATHDRRQSGQFLTLHIQASVMSRTDPVAAVADWPVCREGGRSSLARVREMV